MRELNRPERRTLLPCFFRDRDFEKFEMQTVKKTGKGKECLGGDLHHPSV